MTSKPPSDDPSAVPMRIIVRRGALRRFDALTQKSADLPVVIEWDRRQGDRRSSSASAGAERRASDRRRPPPFTWELADFVVAAPEGAPPPGDDGETVAAAGNWDDLEHAYGSASDIPGLLAAAARDPRRGHEEGSAWFALWSALCHQGDAYSASLAAVPHLIRMAPAQLALQHCDALLLAASIELARLEGRAPAVPAALESDYDAALRAGRALAEQILPQAWDEEAAQVLRGSMAVFSGDVPAAREIFDAEATGDDHS